MNSLPIEMMLKQRWLNFFISGLNHSNNTIADFFKNSLLSVSSYLVSNLNIVMDKLGISYHEIFCLRRTDIKKKILQRTEVSTWETVLLSELMEIRDGIRVANLSYEEVDHVINHICTTN